MKSMSWEEIDKDWGGLQKRHRVELAQAITRYCIGHKLKEVAERIGYSEDWTRRQLDYAGIAAAVGGGAQLATPPLVASGKRETVDDRNGIDRATNRVLSEFGPDIKVKLADDGFGNQKVASIEGKDAEQFEPYIDHYIEQGHEPAAATRLAKAEWAAEAAVEAGVIKEDVNKRNEKVNRILFPDDGKDTFELDLKMHISRVKAAARFLDEAKINYLRRKSTCEMVESANEAWVEQVERVLTFHTNHQ
jgi:hypothetical protein